MSANGKMTAARTSLVLESPFFGSLALSLQLKADTTCETAWVDGRTLGYNPTFVESLSHDRVLGLVAHEVMHPASGHCWRRDGRDPKQWNKACDMAINPILRDSGFKLPEGGLFPAQFGMPEGKSAEWYYSHAQESDNDGQGKGSGQGNNPNGQSKPDPLGEVRDAPTGPDSDGEPAPTESDWKQRAAQALQVAKAMGNAPGGLVRAVQQALKPRIDVRSLLLRFFSERSTGDYSWSKPNSRYIASGLYLPALESKSLGDIAVFIDTSGSMDQTSLAYAAGITEQVIEECDPASVTLYFADTKVCHSQRLERGDPLTWEPAGGGGTDFRDVLRAIEEDGTAVCAVCLTDLDGTLPDTPPSYPVLWLCTTGRIAPFGETIPIEQ